ncbi:MAG: hypothetical protein DI565_15670 [Ancylobacter novellus]|uniref:Uncharacterized protein n=1 Tax=Ancylobacter novellus TaxID=921 RepID=A0A2W5M0B3_ANCNO|nr:MAG: hypothetical protein DI565_15670 [Ancylobacter novellus]
MRTLLLALAATLLAVPAAARSAEETALFITTGVEAGATTRNRAGEVIMRYAKTSDAPLTLTGERIQSSPGFSDTTVTVERDGCRFTVKTSWDQSFQGETRTLRGETSIDLTDANAAAVLRRHPDEYDRAPPAIIDYPSAKMEARLFVNGEFAQSYDTFTFFSDQEKLDQAIARMRADWCPGRTAPK